MSDPSAGFLEFALKAWHNRHYVMQAQGAEARTRRIYNYYNYFDCIRDPGLCSVLAEIELQFQKCANLKFYFQNHSSVKLSGNSIAEMAGYLNDLLGKDSSKLVLLQKEVAKQYSKSVFDNETRTLRAPKTERELVDSDPAFLLDQFLWHKTTRTCQMAKYRIYVTPRTFYSPIVFCYLAYHMDAHSDVPSSGKLIVPGPLSKHRADKIVLYCQDKEELDNGIKLLKVYQEQGGARQAFENISPLSTKPVKGLQGVAITAQPTPDAAVMNFAGIKRVKGISFGMSRAAIIYNAMRDNYRPPTAPNTPMTRNTQMSEGNDVIKFINDCYRIARIANIDIEQKQSGLEV